MFEFLKKKQLGSAELRAEHARLADQLAGAKADLRQLEQARESLLASDDVDAAGVVDHDRNVAIARVTVERLAKACELALTRAAEAEHAEHVAELTAEGDALDREMADAAAWLRRRYPELAGEIVENAARLGQLDARRRVMRERMKAAGIERDFDPVERRIVDPGRLERTGQWGGFSATLRLPDPAHGATATLWPQPPRHAGATPAHPDPLLDAAE